jgi:signal transduction histidine kinase
MLSADPPNVDGARETARRTIRDGDRASAVIGRLRALFGNKAFAAERVDLNTAALEVIDLARHELNARRISVSTRLDEDLPQPVGDRIQLQQVVLNLLLNASDALSDVDDRPRRIFVETERRDEMACLIVRDTGAGIPADAMQRLFDAFYTTKPQGMGIGLSVSRSIVERHEGHLWAEQNDDGVGAAFSLSLPFELVEAS